jgi:hypothetical protein
VSSMSFRHRCRGRERFWKRYALLSLISVNLFLIDACSTGPQIESPVVYSTESIYGHYRMSATVKPYIKFGGPDVGAGDFYFDGAGNLKGNETWFGQKVILTGKYQVFPDGKGSANLRAVSGSGGTAASALKITLEIRSPQEVWFATDDTLNFDYESAGALQARGQSGVTGRFTKMSY